jgi:MoaA/NifB/PqqE/SkfB family radical SAM enzyme
VRLLVVHPPVAIARDFVDYPYFSDLGAVQLAAVLRARGDDVALVNAYAMAGSTLAFRKDGRAHLGAPLDEVLAGVERARDCLDAALVAYTPFHRPPHRDELYAGLLRGMRAMLGAATPIVLCDAYQSGQHYVESDGVLAAYPEADAWVKYEAELAVPRMLEGLAGGTRPRGIVRGEGPDDLDALPDPAWDLVDLGSHDRFRARVVAQSGRGRWAFPIGGRTLPMITSRGCPFRCAHCSSNPGRREGEPKTQRRMSEPRLRAAVQTLARAHGATRIEVLDELVNVRKSHFDAFLSAVEEVGIAFDVPNGFRADYLRREQLERMRGRVTTVSVSAESGVQRVVDEVVGKELDLREIARVAEEAHEIGVPAMVHYIVGMPGESAEEINGTLALALDLWDRFRAEPAVQFATPLPGTRLASGRTLPVVEDWGPAFQTKPSQPGAEVSAETLLAFKRTFDRRLEASRGPEKLIVNLTYACNNHCTFCAVGTRTQVHGATDKIHDWLALYRERGVKMVDFDGGEPTLHPDLFEVLARSRALGYERVHVTTNGRMCAYGDFAERLVGSGVTSIAFSVHGADAKVHAQQVGVAEAFDQTIEGIRQCVARARDVELGMNVTLTKGNTAHLPGIAKLAWDLGLRWLNVQFLTPFGRATKWVNPDTAEAARVTARVIDEWRSKMKVQVINLPFCFMPGYEAHLEGDLAKLARHMVFVNNESVNLAQYLAERRTKKPVCATCPHASFCGGFYELEDVPEPPWLVTPEDLLRPVRGHSSGS